MAALIRDARVNKHYLSQFEDLGKKAGLKGFELVSADGTATFNCEFGYLR